MKKQSIGYFFLVVLVGIVAISYHSTFFGVDTTSNFTPFIIATTLIVFISAFKPKVFLKEKIVKKYIASIFITFFLAVLFLADGHVDLLLDTRSIILPLLFLSIGYCLDLSEKQIVMLCFVFVIVVSFSALSQILSNIGAFVIEEQNLVAGKNSLGAIVATASITSFLIAFLNRKKAALFLLFVALGIFLIVIVLTMRSRTSAVCIFFFFIVYVLKLKLLRPQHFVYLLLFCTILFIISRFSGIFSTAFDYIYDSFMLNHEGDLTSDRTRRNIEAWEIIKNDPFFGRMSSGQNVQWVHNYLLRVVSDYGILGASPLVYLYFMLAITIFNKLRKIEIKNIYNIGYITMIVPLITSLAEPTYPFEPGTAVFFSYVLLGVSLSKSSIINKTASSKNLKQDDINTDL